MSNDRVTAVYDTGVVTAFVEHTYIQTKYICHIDGTAHTAFVRADHGHMLCIDLQILYILAQCLNELVSRLHGLEAVQRDRVLYARIVRVKGDDVVNAHIDQFLQSQCAVQRLSCAALVLAAFI